MARDTQDALLKRFLKIMDDTGWGGYVIRRRADEDRALALAYVGIASSVVQVTGEDEWRLNLSRAGQALRKKLVEKEALDA